MTLISTSNWLNFVSGFLSNWLLKSANATRIQIPWIIIKFVVLRKLHICTKPDIRRLLVLAPLPTLPVLLLLFVSSQLCYSTPITWSQEERTMICLKTSYQCTVKSQTTYKIYEAVTMIRSFFNNTILFRKHIVLFIPHSVNFRNSTKLVIGIINLLLRKEFFIF